MDENEYYAEIKEYLSINEFPAGFNENQKCILQKKADKFEVKEGILHRRIKSATLRIVTSATERIDLIKQAHLDCTAGRHNDPNKMVNYIRNKLGCYWKSTARDVQNYVLTCDDCITSTGQTAVNWTKFELNWREVAVQILGPFFKTDDGSEYIAILIDPFSCWVEGGVLKSLCPEELSSFLFKTFTNVGFCQYAFIGLEKEFAEKTNLALSGLCVRLSEQLQQLSANQFCASGDSEVNCNEQTEGNKETVLETESHTLRDRLSLIANLKKSASVPRKSNLAVTCQEFCSIGNGSLPLTVEDLESKLKTVFGFRFPSLLEHYTQCIHSLVESNPLMWDRELERTLFQLRIEIPEGYSCCAFSAMFHRNPLPKINNRITSDVCDEESDSDCIMDDESDCEATSTALYAEVDSHKEITADTSTPKRQIITTRARQKRRTVEEDAAYIPSINTPVDISSALNCTNIVTSRYGLRTNLKAKGNSSMVERFLRLSSAKRSLNPADSLISAPNVTPKRKRRAILSSMTSSIPGEENCLNIKEEQVDNEICRIETTGAIPTLAAEPSIEESAAPFVETSSSPSELLSVQESMVRDAIVIKIPEQVSLLKCNQPANCEDKLHDVIELPAEEVQVIPKEVHVTIVADNDIPTEADSEEQLQESHVKLELPLSDEENEDITIIDHTSLVKKRRKKIGKSRKMAKELPHKCPKCVATYLATPQELKLHLECHVPDEKLLRCPHCPKTVRNWSHLQRHLLTHDDLAPLIRIVPEDKRKCTFCGKVFSTREGMLRHEQVIHKEFHRFECRICGRKYKERKTFKRHMDLHANVVYKCEVCKYKTKIRRNLIDHNRIHEGRGFQCEVCSKIFTKQSILSGHMEIHNTNRSSLICEQCGMKLANAASLRQHVRNIHEKPGQFPCSHCNYIGKTKGNLMSHTDRAHNKPFKCPHCPYSCKCESALKRHTDIFHNVLERRFACSVCPYRARDPKQLSEHMRFRHNPNALRFPCQFCSMKFKTMTMLRHHLPAHTGQHLYSCQLCGYSAKYRQTVHHHVKVKHPGQRVSNLVKGTPCSEIPCSVLSDNQLDQAIARVADQECTVYMPEGVVIAEHEPGLFVAKILETVKEEMEENMIAQTADVNILTTQEESIAIPSNSTIELQFITEEENGKNVAMKIIPTQEQTEKAVELLLLAMDPHQTVTEVVSEETVHTTE